jgi:hypothetical protein
VEIESYQFKFPEKLKVALQLGGDFRLGRENPLPANAL